MLKLNSKHIENIDWLLTFIVVALLVVSVIAIYSAGYDPETGVSKSFYQKQIYWSFIGLATYLFFSLIGHRRMVKFGYVFYVIGLLALIVVLMKGYIGMGSRRWIAFGSLRIQPSEIFKFIWVLTLSRIFIDMDGIKLGLFDILKKSILIIPPFILIFLQPDLGTAGTFFIIWGMVLMVVGIQRATFIMIIVSMLLAMPVMWAKMKPYQKKRVITFLNPEKDPFGSGYHVIQSKIGIGSGGLTGKGYLKGTQSHLKFIPERHTDFIFSVVAEEFGLMGAGVIIILFLFLILRIIFVSVNAREPAGKIICVATASFVFFQFFVNVSMTIGMMPVVGIPMPLVSYGGSSLVTFMAMFGLVNGVSMRRFDPGDA